MEIVVISNDIQVICQYQSYNHKWIGNQLIGQRAGHISKNKEPAPCLVARRRAGGLFALDTLASWWPAQCVSGSPHSFSGYNIGSGIYVYHWIRFPHHGYYFSFYGFGFSNHAWKTKLFRVVLEELPPKYPRKPSPNEQSSAPNRNLQ